MTGGRAAGVATGAVALLLVLLPASPARAGAAITLDDPVVSGANATISGSAEMTIVEGVTGVTITATSSLHPDVRPSCDGCGADVATNQRTVSFSHTFEGLAVNGPYEVRVEVRGKNLINSEPTLDAQTREIRIQVPPAAPADVRADPNPDGTVTVRWSRNTEPDLAHYRVQRRDLAGGLQAKFEVPQPADGTTVVWTDTTAGLAGRRFEYQVVAVRRDGDGAVSSRAEAVSAPAAASVPASATPGAPGAPGLPGGGAAPSSRGPADPSSASGATAAGRPPAEPDGTFSQTLPFGPGNNKARAGAAPDDAVVILGHTTNKRAIVLPIAAGLFMCVAAAHLRRFSRRMFPSSLEAGP